MWIKENRRDTKAPFESDFDSDQNMQRSERSQHLRDSYAQYVISERVNMKGRDLTQNTDIYQYSSDMYWLQSFLNLKCF